MRNFVGEFIILGFAIIFPLLIRSQRNDKEEAICAPFLTSAKTSPLVEGLERNLKVDEDAEFSCELVLQDIYLPPQIRLTIHEGLFYLALRHIRMGLSRQRTAARHAKILASMVPSNFRFQFYAGSFAIHHDVHDPTTAVAAFRECLYGNASLDMSITSEEKFSIRRDYISALLALDEQAEAASEVQKLLDANPFDFASAFVWKTYQSFDNKERSSESRSWFPKETDELERVISTLTSLNTVSFPSFDNCALLPDSNQPITTFDHMVSVVEFEKILHERIPVKISAGSVRAVSEALEFHVHDKWFIPNSSQVDFNYLRSRIGDEEDVLAESTHFVHCDNDQILTDLSRTTNADYDKPCVAFGQTLGARRRAVSFHSLLDNNFYNKDTMEAFYINVQGRWSGEAPYRPPLHLLKDDLPISSNDTIMKLIRDNLSDINLWMSNTNLQSSIAPHPHLRPTASRLHRDAEDNLYIVLEGEKQFSLWHPCHYRDMKTISPSYHVNKDGLATQFDVNAFKNFVRHYVSEKWSINQAKNHGTSGKNSTSQEDIDSRQKFQESEDYLAFVRSFHPILQKLLADSEKNVQYDTVNIHFSQKSSHSFSSFLSPLPPPTMTVTIRPGDVLYLPTGWFHEVTSIPGRQTALNFWWKPPHWQTALKDEEAAQSHLFEGLVEHFTRLHMSSESESLVHTSSREEL